MRTVEFDGSPLGVEAVDPVVATEWVGDADGQGVEATGLCCVSKVTLERQLFHDGVADQFLIEVDLGAQASSADVEEDAFAAHAGGDFDGTVPPGDAEPGAVLREGVFGGVTVLVGRIGALAKFAPQVLLDGAREGDAKIAGRVRRENLPATGRDVHWKRLAAGHGAVWARGDLVGQVEGVVLPLCLLVHPEVPAVIGNERAVLWPGERFGEGWLRERRECREEGGRCGGLQEGAARERLWHRHKWSGQF